HPKTTIIKGQNSTGKSCVIKSICSTFGADPEIIHPQWKKAAVSSLLRFRVDDIPYQIYRHGDTYALFKYDEILGVFRSVTKELAPALSELFDFRLILRDHAQNYRIATPAFLFLPFYIDQDSGWKKNWSSFQRLGQFKDWRKDLIRYHTGIQPNEWYLLKSNVECQKADREDPVREAKVLAETITRLEQELASTGFDIDVESFKKEIDELLVKCEILRKEEEKYRRILSDLETDRIRLEAQKEIVTRARTEISSDYEYADKLEGDFVECPTCGAQYENTFVERFGIARDEDRCLDLLQEIESDLASIQGEINQHKYSLSETNTSLDSIEALLVAKKGKLTLQDLIQNEGRKNAISSLKNRHGCIRQQVLLIDEKIAELEKQLGMYEDLARKKQINNVYIENMEKNLYLLDVTGLRTPEYKSIFSNMKATGSEQPRAIMAYFFSILRTIRRFGSSTYCPVIIDAPRQQEQDETNHFKILQFLQQNRPEESQMIVGLVDDCGIDFDGNMIEMKEKNHVLSENLYPEIVEEIKPYLEAMLNMTN
ncbi:MAG: hypothetical protein ABFD12_02035, partial [Syntrophorhabdus sp.]